MESIARLFKALTEPVRLRILLLLLDEERCVCDLMAVLDLPQSTISRHLAYLKNTGWVEGERRGGWMYYRLTENRDGFREELRQILAGHLPLTEQGIVDRKRLRLFLTQGERDKSCR
ncbi:MAG: metalloregulator ArsR/SmtB family transcription factor [Desulfurivibrionaceae bacterium]